MTVKWRAFTRTIDRMAHSCSKTFLSLLNSLLILAGIALIVLSSHIYRKYQSAQLISGIIVLAFFVIVIGLLGFIGVLKRSNCGKYHLHAVHHPCDRLVQLSRSTFSLSVSSP